MTDGIALDTRQGKGILAAAILGSGMATLGRHRRQRRAAADRPGPRREPGAAAVDHQRLHAVAGLTHPDRRIAGRPVRPPRVFEIGVVWFAVRLAALRDRDERRAADRRPDPAGHRRRPAHAGQPGDDPGRDPAARPRQGDRVVVRVRRDRDRDRPVPRRLADRVRVLALDLPAQPAAGRGHARRRRSASCPRPATPTRSAAST